MGAALLISDLHLSEATPSIEAGLSHFLNREILQHSQRIEQLFILGDFFEAWVGDDDDAPYIERVKSLLRQVVASGTSVYWPAVIETFCWDNLLPHPLVPPCSMTPLSLTSLD